MTRKDYVAIAKAIAYNRPLETDEFLDDYDAGVAKGCDAVAIDLCDIFAADNPNFNRVKFLEACKGRL